MKEAIGGTWLFVIVITFLALFTAFISLSTNYSRCYRIKDEILTSIEVYHGISKKTLARVNSYLNEKGYSARAKCPEDGNCWYGFSSQHDDRVQTTSYYNSESNYCISKHVVTGTETTEVDGVEVEVVDGPVGHPESAYYSVAVFFQLSLPIFRQAFTVPIYGETSIIYLPRNELSDVANGKCGS